MNPYQVLGIAPDADEELIKAAYRVRARQRHPDRGSDTVAMTAVNAAYEIVSDPATRSALDLWLGRDRAEDERRRQAIAEARAAAAEARAAAAEAKVRVAAAERSAAPEQTHAAPMSTQTAPAGPDEGPRSRHASVPGPVPAQESAKTSSSGTGAVRGRTVNGPGVTSYSRSPYRSPDAFPRRDGGSVTAWTIRATGWLIEHGTRHVPDSAVGMMLLGTVVLATFVAIGSIGQP